MSSTRAVKGPPIAFFDIFCRAKLEDNFISTDSEIPIYARDEFQFGRSSACEYQCSDPTVSNIHIRVYCIVFEEDHASGIPPVVYVQDHSSNGTCLRHASYAGEREQEHRLLSHASVALLTGDNLVISSTLLLRFRYAKHIEPSVRGLDSCQTRESELFKDRYTITDQIIGSGAHGEVFVAKHRKTSQQFACKVVNRRSFEPQICQSPPTNSADSRDGSPSRPFQRFKKSFNEGVHGRQFREIDVLKELNHPNIVRLEKVFWSSQTIFIFQELVTGGDLFSFIEHKGGRVPDVESAVIIYQILKGVEYLHDRNVVHRDLKPDNVLITSLRNPFRIVITDFGACRRIDHTDAPRKVPARMSSVVGTLEFTAPEMYGTNSTLGNLKGYTKAVDLWSLGIITTALLTGDVIFTDRNSFIPERDPAAVKNFVIDQSAQCDLGVLDDNYGPWRKIGKRPKDFVRKLLVLNEALRMTVKQALAHEWFTNSVYADELKAVYDRAIHGWQSRNRTFCMVEALDQSRLNAKSSKPSIAGSRTSPHFSCPFPQGELRSRPNKLPKQLSTIGEERTPEPDTPGCSRPETPAAPKSKRPGRLSRTSGVEDPFSQLSLGGAVRPSQAETDVATAGAEDLTLSDPERHLSYSICVADTPPSRRKRQYSSELGDGGESGVHELIDELRMQNHPKLGLKKARLA